MKRWICALTALLFLLAQTTTAFAEKQEDWTLAIYMVGTDLESEHGLATKDLVELIHGSCTSDITVYLCTGGSKAWSFPIISSDECAVWKIKGGGITKIASLGECSMGSAQTLHDFVQLIPSTAKMALILWDHGGGPILGLCKDEIYSNDTLMLPEIAQGLKNGPHWELIGADACSLSSIEMAGILQDYASYAILSQETEASAGWDYSSLLDALSSSHDGAEAGALIADTVLCSWLEPYEEWPEFAPAYALAVLDLSKLDAAEEALAGLLSKLEQSVLLGGSSFQTQLLEQQIAQPGRYTSATQLDTTDIVSMAKAYQTLYPTESSLLLAALDELITCVSTNTKLHGLSLYLPHENQQLYASAEKLLDQILLPEQLSYARTYTEARSKVTAVFDEPIFLETEGTEITYQLSKAQQEHFASGSVLLYAKEENDSYALLSAVGDITPDEHGVLRYKFENRALWMTAADGSRTIIPLFDPRSDGSVNRARAYAILMAENGSMRNVLLDVAFNETHAQITGIHPTDTVHGKSTLQLSDFTHLLFSGGGFIPKNENGRVRPFSDWAYSPEMTIAILPIVGLTLRFEPFDAQLDLYAQFQIRDVYGEIHSSELFNCDK